MNSLTALLARLIRLPVLHFLAIGSLLFLADGWRQEWSDNQAGTPAGEVIVVSARQIQQIREDFLSQQGTLPTAQELSAAVDAAVDEEILFRKAREIGLDRRNPVVRNRLVQIAGFVSEDPNQDEETLYQAALRLKLDSSDMVIRRHLAMLMRLAAANAPIPGETPPSDSELAAYQHSHPQHFMQPWRVSLVHVYLSDDLRGARAEADALQLLRELRASSSGPDAAAELGDPYMFGHELKLQTWNGLQKAFDARFADAVARMKPGAWSGPVRSGFGWHLVWVRDVRPPTMAPLAAVRERVLREVLEQRREWRVEETLKTMRKNYTIKVEMPISAMPAAGTADAIATGGNG